MRDLCLKCARKFCRIWVVTDSEKATAYKQKKFDGISVDEENDSDLDKIGSEYKYN